MPPPADLGQPIPEANGPANAAAARGIDDALADVDAGGLGEALSTVPNFIGDGCAPGAGASQLPIGRLAIASIGMRVDTVGSLQGQSAGVYKFPDALDSVAAIQAAGITGIPAGAVPLTTIPGPIVMGITNPAGGPDSITTPGNDYPVYADTAFQTLYPGVNGVTAYVPSASGFIPLPVTSGVVTADSYAFYDYVVDTAVLMPGANVGFVKLSENVSPLPRDRVYFNYSYFHNALLGDIRNDINRFTPGFEKTFADGWTSIEVRTPFAATLANTQTLDPTEPCGIGDAQAVEFGNMSVIFKSVIGLGSSWAWTGGMQVTMPTAGDVLVNAAPGGPAAVRIDNRSVRLMPFMAGIWAPNDVWFSQALLQMDTAANGNPAFLAVPGQTDLQNVGQLQYPTFMYLSFSTGYWAYRSAYSRLTGFAPIAEIHVNQAMQTSDVIQGATYRLGADYGVVSLVNGLVGCNFEWGNRSTLTLAYVTPFGGGADRWFDGEFRAFWNWRFGPQNRLTRVQF
ncbi:MAG: hypothetical protein ACKONH_08080 [Planctomycetia bacterium]